jgi:hypothetical protein
MTVRVPYLEPGALRLDSISYDHLSQIEIEVNTDPWGNWSESEVAEKAKVELAKKRGAA